MTAANDAFGNTVGLQTIGLYNPTNVRGFNPTQAENLRIEGLYFDEQTLFDDLFLFASSSMRVGIAAQSYSFPSPTGIADFKLRTPGDTPLLSVLLTRGPLDMATAEIDTEYPLISNTLSAGVNVADWENLDYNLARKSSGREVALILRFHPSAHTEIIPFYGFIHGGERGELPTVYADGVNALPQFRQQGLPAQAWTSWGWRQTTAGVIARSALSTRWQLSAGLFHSVEDDPQNFDDLLLGLMRNGTADHVMDVVPPLRASSYSGELRLARRVTDGPHQHELTFALRGRHIERSYGGDSVSDLGIVSIDRGAGVPRPPLAFTAASQDDVSQHGLGISYNERWQGVGTATLGLMRTDYRRTIATPGTLSIPQHTDVVLPTASFTVEAGRAVTLYGSYTRGLEDSVNAPASAVNRGEPPPATRTWQIDGGVRVAPKDNLQLVLGVFKVHKAYFSLNTADLYERLGDISSRGVEGSATFNGTHGLTVVAGFVLLKTEVARQIPELNGIGTVPIGPVPQTINLNVDYAPARWGRWAASLQWTWLSSRVETNDDLSKLPPLSTVDVGLRYTSKLFGHACSARLDAANLTNTSGLMMSPQYVALPQLRRNYTLTLALDI